MNRLYNSFVLAFLNENYPQIVNEIERNFQSDLSEIRKVADKFCEYHGIEIRDIQEIRIGKFLKLRYKFICCVLYLFQPRKLITNEQLNLGIAKELKLVTKLGSANLNQSLKAGMNLMLYKEFKSDVIHFCSWYKLIK
ncbi:hypothetical protein [Sphingobacterium sp. 1.A.4]|uniref:hypothetical protein n=1 Tax=Sphingobacterium sp. 1.A.4 TaxID=2044603 RepID=UPI000C0BF85F|nr:hypothetical protein [Sphingobacterium sp. 1.A.4]